MSRPLRVEFAGALCHVFARGNEKRPIYVSTADYELFLELLAECIELFRWRLYTFELMPNHYHLQLETPEPNLARGMHKLNGEYAAKFNRRHARVGHLFQGRYKSILVENEAHLLELMRYIVLNPVNAELCRDPAEWRWTSYRAVAGLEEPPPWLDVHWTLRAFDPLDRENAQRRYREFVAAGVSNPPAPCEEPFLGSKEFRISLQEKLPEGSTCREYPQVYRDPCRPSFADVIATVSSAYDQNVVQLRNRGRSEGRAVLAYLARRSGVAVKEIAAFLKITPAGVDWLISRAKQRLNADEEFNARLTEVVSRTRAPK